MPRRPRIEYAGAVYHLMARGNRRKKIFTDDRDRERFLECLERAGNRFGLEMIAVVLMANHYHLLVRTPEANLSRVMHWLATAYTTFFNRRHRLVGHLFQGRYKSIVVEASDYLLRVSRYLHLNPVRGRVLGRGTPAERRQRLRAYRWSSYREYAGLGKCDVTIEKHSIYGTGGRDLSAKEYRQYVEEGLLRELENPFEATRWQSVLGGESFLQKIKDQFFGNSGSRKAASSNIGTRRLGPKEVLEIVAEDFNLSADILRQPAWGRNGARAVAMALVWDHCDVSLKEVQSLFAAPGYHATAQMIRRIRKNESERLKRLGRKLSSAQV